MSLTSQEFIAALEPERDVLYTRARRATDGARGAEAAMVSAVRRAFSSLLASGKSDVIAAIAAELPADRPEVVLEEADAAMPADTWARLTAAVQIEAAKAGGSSSLDPAHVLLTPDPLLAPKKRKRTHEPVDGFGFTPTSRFLIAAIAALILGLVLTTVILTRSASTPAPQPATQR